MSWIVLVALVVALACGLRTEPAPILSLPWQVPLLLSWLGPLVAILGSWLLVQRSKQQVLSASNFLRQARALEAITLLLWCVGAILFCACSDPLWNQVATSKSWQALRPLFNAASLLLPILLLLLATWSGLFQLQWAWQGMVDRQEGTASSRISLTKFLLQQLGQKVFPLLIPALAMLLLQAGLERFSAEQSSETVADTLPQALPRLGNFLESSALLMGVVFTVTVLSPWALRISWPASPLPAGEVRSTVLQTLSYAGCEVREVLVWKSQTRSFNAALVGYLPRLRYLFVTERLVQMLPLSQLAAILRHEAAHARYAHLPKRLGVLALPWLLWQASLGYFGETLLLNLWMGLALFVLGLLYVIYGVGRYSWLLEYEADAAVCFDSQTQMLDPECAEQFLLALRKMERAGSGGADWTHPPLAKRVAFLQSILQKPKVAWQFRRQLHQLEVLLLAVGAALVAAIVVQTLHIGS